MYYARIENRACQDCGHDTKLMGEMYMVQHDLWVEVLQATSWANMLCIGCFESRLGRPLCNADFLEWAPINWYPMEFQSLRLRARLNAGVTNVTGLPYPTILDTEAPAMV